MTETHETAAPGSLSGAGAEEIPAPGSQSGAGAVDDAQEDAGPFPGWAIVELMGHRRRAGWVSEETRFGVSVLRVDIPDGDLPLAEASQGTQFYSGPAIYAITPCTEATARSLAGASRPAAPVRPAALPGPQEPHVYEIAEDGDEDEFADGRMPY